MKKRKNLALFLAGVLLAAVLLFWPAQKEPGRAGANQSTEAEAQSQNTGPQQEAASTKEPTAERETTFWYWKGAESGVPCEAYLSLCSDGTYILRTILSQHDPQEESGCYRWKGTQGEILQLQSPSGLLRGTRSGPSLQLGERTYERTGCSPI